MKTLTINTWHAWTCTLFRSRFLPFTLHVAWLKYDHILGVAIVRNGRTLLNFAV